MSRVASDRAFAIDAGAALVISVAICTASRQLHLMTALVPAVILVRFVLWARLPVAERGSLGVELAFFAVATVAGGFNDWNTVVRHGVYDYGVPHYFPQVSTIPLWMLLYWGLILRSLVTLFRWRRLDPTARRDSVFVASRVFDSATLKVLLQLGLLLVTRQMTYVFYEDPVLSWLPFAVAMVAYVVLFRPDVHDWRLIAIFAVAGPLIEVLYINVGGLHRYRLGWIGGVPLWIALWWVLAMPMWKDLSDRIASALERLLEPRAASETADASAAQSDRC